jgi:hypothetical protein
LAAGGLAYRLAQFRDSSRYNRGSSASTAQKVSFAPEGMARCFLGRLLEFDVFIVPDARLRLESTKSSKKLHTFFRGALRCMVN